MLGQLQVPAITFSAETLADDNGFGVAVRLQAR
jgi:hypothetical protein